jgi:hypothetical protein
MSGIPGFVCSQKALRSFVSAGDCFYAGHIDQGVCQHRAVVLSLLDLDQGSAMQSSRLLDIAAQ